MPGPFADDAKCQEFVTNLKRMRDVFGWSQEDLAVRAHVGKGTVAMTESFQRAPQVDHGVAYDAAFGLKDVFTKSAREIQGQSFPEVYQDFPALEAAAHDLYVYEHSLFPGLIQTERYARAVLAKWPNIRAEDVERRVSGRLARQEEALHREGPPSPRVWALIDEAALHRPIGDAAVMYEQFMHALEVSGLPGVSLAVVPYAAGGHIGLLGACTIVERDGVPHAMYLDDLVDGRVLEDPALVRQAALRFRALQHEALSGGESRDMIERLAKELWTG
ncbi:MAG: Scr1 family TA system antitoxin-like transcriptional regulator [Trebonia sp.]